VLKIKQQPASMISGFCINTPAAWVIKYAKRQNLLTGVYV